jgi:hypothetical protein
MFLWYPVLDLARAPRRTARKKGSGYENGLEACIFEIIELNQKFNLINGLTGQTRILFSVSMERSGLCFSNTYSANGPHSNVI